MKAMAIRRWVAGAGLGVLVVFGACSGTATLDQDDLQEQLRVQLSEDAGVDADGVTVECPSGIEVEEGRTFDCELTAPNGDLVTVEVTLTDDDGSFEAVVPDQQFDE